MREELLKNYIFQSPPEKLKEKINLLYDFRVKDIIKDFDGENYFKLTLNLSDYRNSKNLLRNFVHNYFQSKYNQILALDIYECLTELLSNIKTHSYNDSVKFKPVEIFFYEGSENDPYINIFLVDSGNPSEVNQDSIPKETWREKLEKKKKEQFKKGFGLGLIKVQEHADKFIFPYYSDIIDANITGFRIKKINIEE